MARVAVQAENREKLYARARAILQQNVPIIGEWAAAFGGFLTYREPRAGALCLLRYRSATASCRLSERIRVERGVLIVPGAHLGLEGYLRLWLGGAGEFLREGLRRVGVMLRGESAL